MTASGGLGRLVRRQWPWLLVALVGLVGTTAVTAILIAEPALTAGSSMAGLDGAGPSPSAYRSQQPSTLAVLGAPSPARTQAPRATRQGRSFAARQAWADVARGFGRTFTHTVLGQDAWFAAMSSWLTDEQAARYRDVPIRDIPSGTLERVDVRPPGRRDRTTGTLTYDTGMRLNIGLIYATSSGGWLVASVRPAGPSG